MFLSHTRGYVFVISERLVEFRCCDEQRSTAPPTPRSACISTDLFKRRGPACLRGGQPFIRPTGVCLLCVKLLMALLSVCTQFNKQTEIRRGFDSSRRRKKKHCFMISVFFSLDFSTFSTREIFFLKLSN